MKFIESQNNKEFKDLKKLISRSGARKSKNFIVEGKKELLNCKDCGFNLTKIYICSEFFDTKKNKIEKKI